MGTTTWIKIIRQRHAEGVYPDDSCRPVACDETLTRRLRALGATRDPTVIARP